MLKGIDLLPHVEGWWSLGIICFPLHWKTKAPAFKDWGLWQHTKPSWDEVYALFDTHFYRNLAVICGQTSDNLIVLDFDKPLPYYEWLDRTRIDTYTVATSRGFHVYLHLADPPARTLSMGGGEVKANGYVVAYPSTHPSGYVYAVHNDNPIAHFQDLLDAGITPTLPRLSKITTKCTRCNDPTVARIKACFPIATFLNRYTPLRPTSADGRWLIGNCVFHNDNNPSMWVDTKNDYCGCFTPTCYAHRQWQDVINVYAYISGISNGDAIRELSNMIGDY